MIGTAISARTPAARIQIRPPPRPLRARATASREAMPDAFRLRAPFDSTPGLLFGIREPLFVGSCSWLGRQALDERRTRGGSAALATRRADRPAGDRLPGS